MRIWSHGSWSFSALLLISILGLACDAPAQGTSGTIQGIVKDSQGAVIPGANVEIYNPVSGHRHATTSSGTGDFSFSNVPFNSYQMAVTAKGFRTTRKVVDVRSAVPVTTEVTLDVTLASTVVDVPAERETLVDHGTTGRTAVARDSFEKVPVDSPSSSWSSILGDVIAGIARDSDGSVHSGGDHSSNLLAVDGRLSGKQFSKVFSNQIPLNAVSSLEAIPGAPPAEYGGRTSLVIVATTHSGQGVTQPTGSVYSSYGTFGSSTGGLDLAYGGQRWGNFISIDGLNTGRFLDPPELAVMHDKGNEENVFDRIDYQFSGPDSIHIDLGYSRSWFQNPNSFDQQFHFGLTNLITGTPLGPSDQRSKIGTFNIAPAWNHVIGTNAVFTLGAFVDKDQFNYYPSANPFNDFSPDLQGETFAQSRNLTNVGLRSDYSWVKGIHNVKVGVLYQHTFMTEGDTIGIVDPGFVPSAGAFFGCTNSAGVPIAAPCTTLAQFDLTQGGSLFNFHGHADIKETGLYIQDAINKGAWSFNLGVRGDIYRGLSSANQAEPRLGIAYSIQRTNTVLRISYARTLESPFNENLVIASTGCGHSVSGRARSTVWCCLQSRTDPARISQ